MVEDNPRKNGSKTGKCRPPIEHQFKPGNPGRPKGARNKLGEEFVQDLLADWSEHGSKVIQDVRKDKPDQYLKVVASILPKELNVKVSELDELTDDQIAQQLAFVSAQLARASTVAGEGEAQAVTAHSLN